MGVGTAPESPRCDYSLPNPVGLLPCPFFAIGSMLGCPYFAISPDIAFSPTSMPFQGTPAWNGLPRANRNGR